MIQWDVADTEAPIVPGADPPSAERGALTFVWGGWAVMTALAVAFVARYGRNLPVWDDFDMVDVVVGAKPVTIEWLWSLHNEHRVPLPKLILLALYRLFGNDFRAGMFFSVVALATLAGASIAVAARRPGGCRTYDILFPLVLLNLSHATNLLWSWQVQLVSSTVIAGAVILLIVSRAAWPGPGTAAAVGGCLASLALCGANGVALVPALDCWLLAATLAHWNSGLPGGRRRALAAATAAVPGIVLTILYFAGYHGSTPHPTSGELILALRTSLQFISLMFGTEAHALWPGSGLAALTVIASSVLLLAFVAVKGPAQKRPRALGLLCAFGALACLALGVGWGRAGSGEQSGFEPRYVTLVTPIWVVVILTWDICTSPVVQRVVLTTMSSAALILLWPITRDAIDTGQKLALQADQFVADVRRGAPAYVLVKRHTPFMHPSQDVLAEKLALLRKARVGVFRTIQADPAFREVHVPVTPADDSMVRWENGTAHVTGVDPYLHYVLPRAQTVAGIRLKYSHASKRGSPARFRISWTSVAGANPGPAKSYSNWALPTGRDQVTMIWVDDTVKEFWIQPDNERCEFTVAEITLLLR